MAKFFSTLIKVAAVAAIVPYKVEIYKDEGKIKKVSAKSLAAHITYTPGTDGEKSDLSVLVPGFINDYRSGNGIGMGIEVMENAAATYDELFEDEDLLEGVEEHCF